MHGRQSGRFIKGCAFHWTKAVWTHVQQLGLARTFRQREGTHYFIKQLMALPFLPWTHVHDVFRMMEDRAPPSLQPLTSYIKHQRMENPVFPVRSWSVYQFVVRTNNDVEGICLIFIVEFNDIKVLFIAFDPHLPYVFFFHRLAPSHEF